MLDRLQAATAALAEDYAYGALLQAAQRLSARYRVEEKAPTGARLLTQDVEAAAYCASRMPATFAALCRALELTRAALPQPPRTLLDVGAGPGSALWAAQATFPELEAATLLEREPAMAQAGRRLAAGQPLCPAVWQEAALQRAALPPADLVVCAYCLAELPPQDVEAQTRRLWAAAGQALVLVEPGTPEGWARLETCKAVLRDAGAYMLAPCATIDACGLQGDWCHWTARVSRTRLMRLLKGGDVPYEDEKFAFLAVGRQPGQPDRGRIRRHPQLHGGWVNLSLCQGNRPQERRVTRGQDGPAAYKAARKAATGDPWPPAGEA